MLKLCPLFWGSLDMFLLVWRGGIPFSLGAETARFPPGHEVLGSTLTRRMG